MPEKSNYTEIPNEFLDNLTAFTHVERTILLIIFRQTNGWHRESHVISLSFFLKAYGGGRSSLLDAMESLIEKKCIERTQAGSSFSYRVLTPGLASARPKSTPKRVLNRTTPPVLNHTRSGMEQDPHQPVLNHTTSGIKQDYPPVLNHTGGGVLNHTTNKERPKERAKRKEEGTTAAPPSLVSEPSKPSPETRTEPPKPGDLRADGRPFSKGDLVIEAWKIAYLEVRDEKYTIVNGRDNKAALAIAKMIEKGDATQDELIRLAADAWRKSFRPNGARVFCCNCAATLHGFYDNINGIRQELRVTGQSAAPVFAQRRELESKREQFIALLEHQEGEMVHDHQKTPVRIKAANDTREKIKRINAQLAALQED